MLQVAVGAFVLGLVAVDVTKNPTSYREMLPFIGAIIGPVVRWPKALIAAYRSPYNPRHARKPAVPDFMRSWHLL